MRLRLASCFNYQLMSVLFAWIILFLAGTYYWSQDQNSQNEGIVTNVQPRLSKYYAHSFVLNSALQFLFSVNCEPSLLKLINYSCSQKPINDLHLGQVDES